MGCVDAAFNECCGDNATGQALAITDDEIGYPWSKLEDGCQPAQNLVERIKFLFKVITERRRVAWRLDQGAGRVTMACAQTRADGESARSVTLSGGCSGTKKEVRYLGHGAHDNHGLFTSGHATGDDGSGTVDRGRIFDRCAAEFHHNQAHALLLSSRAEAHFY